MSFRLFGSATVEAKSFPRTGTLGMGIAPGGGSEMPSSIQKGNEAIGADASEQTINVTLSEVSGTANCEIYIFHTKPAAGAGYATIYDVSLTSTTNLQFKVSNNSEATTAFWQVTDWGA